MMTIRFRGKKVDIPTSLEELSPTQYEYYTYLDNSIRSKLIDLDYFKVRWFSFLLGLGKADFLIYKPSTVEDLEVQMDEAVNGFFTTSEPIELNFSTPINLLPSFSGYKGPGDWLEGLTFGEFVECYTILEGVNSSTNNAECIDAYNQIARRLYHIPEDDEVPALLVYHAPRLFASVWKAIQSEPVEINGKKLDFRIIFRGGSNRPDDKTGWTGISFEVATAGLFGNLRDVENTDFWTVLIYLYKCKFEYLNEKRNSK